MNPWVKSNKGVKARGIQFKFWSNFFNMNTNSFSYKTHQEIIYKYYSITDMIPLHKY